MRGYALNGSEPAAKPKFLFVLFCVNYKRLIFEQLSKQLCVFSVCVLIYLHCYLGLPSLMC